MKRPTKIEPPTTLRQVTQHTCQRCGASWLPRYPQPPRVCPKCKRDDWAIVPARMAALKRIAKLEKARK